MKKLSKDIVSEHIDYVFKECRICAEHHNYDCVDCPHYEKCYQIHAHLKQLIEGQAEPSEKQLEEFVEKWANDFATATLHDKGMNERIKEMLKEYDKLRRG